MRIKDVIKFIVDIVFPIECLGCNKAEVWLCSSCSRKVKLIESQLCLGCKKKNGGELCVSCKENCSLDGCLSFGRYGDELLSEVIRAFKYKFSAELAQVLANFLFILWKNEQSKTYISQVKNISSLLIDTDWLVVPVPIHARRERWRGFNQSELIAQEFSNKVELDLDARSLLRVKYSKAQAKIKHKNRKENITGAFEWRGEKLNGKSILIIDDVVTTGATLSEIAFVLKEKGAGLVWALTIARG